MYIEHIPIAALLGDNSAAPVSGYGAPRCAITWLTVPREKAVDEFKWNLRVRTTGKGCATVYVRKHQFEVGSPVQFDKEYGGVTALEYVLGAIGADIVAGLQACSRRRRVDVDDIEAQVSGELNNALTHLGVVGEEGHPGVEKVTVKVYVSSSAPEEAVWRIWEEMLERSPLVRTFGHIARLELSMKQVI